MRRRELLAGIGSVGVLGGAGVVALRGLPSFGDEGPASGDGEGPEPLTIETVDAPGSRAGTVEIPSTEQPTFVDFFGTWCPPCIEQMPALGEASDRVGDSVLFVSVTTEAVGRAITEEELVDWWEKHDGDWLLGVDPNAELAARYLAGGYPSAVAIDASGTVQWSDSGIKTADELVAGIEQAIDE
jgi:thiol-disulfide isomerase/thioredoxin